MIEYDATGRRQLARDRTQRLADEYRRARPVHEPRAQAAIRRIASAVWARRRRRVARDPAYRH